MKYILLLLFMVAKLHLNAQNNGNILPQTSFFDPKNDPVALRSDTSLQLLVSEYVLAKSVRARLGQDCRVLKIYQNRSPQGGESLLFEGVYLSKNRQRFTLSIPLLPDTQARFYFVSTQAIVCSTPGCNNCSIDQGNCVGCCTNTNGSAVALPNPLLKVPISIE